MKLALAVLLGALLVVSLTACVTEEKVPESTTISIKDDVLVDPSVIVQRVDTDSDGALEWLVFYRFDKVSGGGPVAAMVYDVVTSTVHPPIVFPYKLRTPDENYLSAIVPNVSMVDVAPELVPPERRELVLSTGNDLSVFRVSASGLGVASDDPPLYRCIGFFRSEAGVAFDAEKLQVTVISGAGYERSQLVTKRYYRPEADGYFITGTTSLVTPFAAAVDFPAGIPAEILTTPYPEKIVLAFFKTLGKTDVTPTLREYLTPQAVADLDQGRLNFGSPFAINQIDFAMVRELAYLPTQDDTKSTLVTVKVLFQSKDGTRSNLSEVRWTVVRDAQNLWKLDLPQ